MGEILCVVNSMVLRIAFKKDKNCYAGGIDIYGISFLEITTQLDEQCP